MWSLIIVLIFASIANGKHEMHKGSQVFGFELSDEYEAEMFHRYEVLSEPDVWGHASVGRRNGSVMLKPSQLEQFHRAMRHAGIRTWLQVEDLMQFLQEDDANRARVSAQRINRVLPFSDWARYDEINAFMVRIAENHPDIAELVFAGLSYENREINYLKISTTNFADPSKPVYFLDAMIHAREWVTTPVAILAIQSLVENVLLEDQDLLENIDWIIMPLVNPDGYEFSHTENRVWRKTRSMNNPQCPGVDGNRNFDYRFATLGVSANPCSDTYPGAEPYSEPETGYVRDILHEHLERLWLYITIHSQGNWVLYGYGDRSLPGNTFHLHHLGSAMGAVMDTKKLSQADHYVVGNSANLLYTTSGTSQDYAQDIGVPFSYTYELPGYGYGHVVPLQFMEHVAQETWEGIKAGARLALLYHRESNPVS